MTMTILHDDILIKLDGAQEASFSNQATDLSLGSSNDESAGDLVSSEVKKAWQNTNGCELSKKRGNPNFFSQDYEDYILSYLFKDQNTGFYVDVGAHHPIELSVTNYFHLHNWHGMNIEPQEEYYKLYLSMRPSDINLNIAIGNFEGSKTLIIPGDGWDAMATFDSKIKEVASLIEQLKQYIEVPIKTLTRVFDENNISEIDFLKIDVENYETEVLEGLDLMKYRPKVMVIEYASPVNGQGYERFEPLLFSQGYKLGMDDHKYNRYYYRNENPELEVTFKEIAACVRIETLIINAMSHS